MSAQFNPFRPSARVSCHASKCHAQRVRPRHLALSCTSNGMYSHFWWLSICAAHLVSGKRQLLPEDPDAFPKYSVLFHNGYPVQNDTAEKWLRDGLRGGEYEFLGQPWADPGVSQRPEIGDGQDDVCSGSLLRYGYTLTYMVISPAGCPVLSYACRISAGTHEAGIE